MTEIIEREIEEGRLRFTPGNHQYRRHWKAGHNSFSESVPSVTGIIGQLDKPGLVHWAAKITAEYILSKKLRKIDPKMAYTLATAEHKKVLKVAGDRGTAAHSIIEQVVLDPEARVKKDPVHRSHIVASVMKKWLKQVGWKKTIESEGILYHPMHGGYCGMVDIIGVVKNKATKNRNRTVLVDIKTSKAIRSPQYPLQLAAYKMAWEHMTGKKIHKCGILHVEFEETGPARLTWHDFSWSISEWEAAFSTLAEIKNLLREGEAASIYVDDDPDLMENTWENAWVR